MSIVGVGYFVSCLMIGHRAFFVGKNQYNFSTTYRDLSTDQSNGIHYNKMVHIIKIMKSIRIEGAEYVKIH